MAKIRNKRTGEIREVSDKELKQYGLDGKLPKAKLGKDVDPFMQNAIGNRINYWEERNANGELPQQINLGNVGGRYTVPPAQDYGDIDESQFGQQNPNYLENPLLTQEIVKEPDYKNSLKLKNQIEDYRNPASKVNFKKPSLSMFPTMGNKYLNRGMQYLNQSIAHANAIGTDPNSWEQPLNYQNGISNNPFLSTDVNKKYTTLRPKQDTYTLPTEDVQLPETQQSLTPKLTKFANGGRQPIIVNDKNDPRLQAYNDSLLVSDIGNRARKYINKYPGEDQFVGDYLPGWVDKNPDINNAWNRLSKLNKVEPTPSKITPIYTDSHIYDYKKPVQPIIYQENRPKEPAFELNQEQQYLPQEEQHLEFDPIGLKKGTYFTRPRQQQEAGQGKIDYFDSKTGKLIKTMGDGGMNQNQFNNLQALGTGVNATQSGINFGKGITDIMGTQLQNNQVQNMENQLYTQSVFSGAIDTRPQEQYGYSWAGRNGLAENGMQIKEIGGITDYNANNNGGEANVLTENKEVALLPNGLSDTMYGDKHSDPSGGIAYNFPAGTKIFSEKLKIETPKGKKSYSDLAKPFETKKDFEMMKAKHGDDIQKRTAEMIIKFKNNKLEQLFELQEKNKLDGLHSKQVQKETMEEYSPIAENGIHIKPENKGKFNATKKRTGKTTEELIHSKNPITKKRAVFALNSKHWSKKQFGGYIEGNEYDLSTEEIRELEKQGYILKY